ncbi:MAG: hypothetical protein EPN22_16395 [Nitrospirae bacterium]|nr:MAG: hypothetical protein EPN22_16395 [Nitrospirota bacterium]
MIKKTLIYLIASCAMIFTALDAGADELQGWRPFGQSETNYWYYRTKDIEFKTDGVVRIWSKAAAKGKIGIDDKIKLLQKFGGNTKGYEQFSHSVSLFEINCNQRKSRVVSVTDYDKNGKSLESVTVPDFPWDSIGKGTIMDNLSNIVCRPNK